MDGAAAAMVSPTIGWQGPFPRDATVGAEETARLKACEGFILRNLTGEYMLMPTCGNIAAFHGALLMNELAVFVWERLQAPVTRDELLAQILAAYEIDVETATLDLEALLKKMKRLGVIMDCA